MTNTTNSERKIKQIEILPAKNGWVMEATFLEPSGPDESAGYYSTTDAFVFPKSGDLRDLSGTLETLIAKHGGAA